MIQEQNSIPGITTRLMAKNAKKIFLGFKDSEKLFTSNNSIYTGNPIRKDLKILNKNECNTIYWKTGHSHIKRKVNLEKALAGFEKSCHFFFNQPLGYGYDDGINSAIQVCHLLDNNHKKMSEIISELPNTYQSPTMAPFCEDNENIKLLMK